MPRVFRQQYTRPIPPDAKRVTIPGKNGKPDRPAVRFKGPDGKTITASLTRGGDRCRVSSPTWYGEYRDATGDVRRVPLCENKAAAEAMLAELVKKGLLGQAGIKDDYEQHRPRPLLCPACRSTGRLRNRGAGRKPVGAACDCPGTAHLSDYRRELEARGDAPHYVALVAARLADLIEGCDFRLWPDIDGNAVMTWLDGLRRKGRPRPVLPEGKDWLTAKEAAAALGVKTASFRKVACRRRVRAEGCAKARRYARAAVETMQDRAARGASVETSNAYLLHFKSFCEWMVADQRMPSSPVARLEGGNVGVDRRHDRRELSADELRRLLAAARASSRPFRGLTREDRFHLFPAACGTGFRAAALASLTPESFDLNAATPTVSLAAQFNKSRKTKVQPLPADVAELLRAYLAGKPAGERAWGGTWASLRVGAEMLRLDLEAAGIPYAVDGSDGPKYADFHALRHSYLTLGGRAGIDLRTLQEFAGHSTPELTARYSHCRLHDLAGAVERLPDFLPGPAAPEALRATGTDGAHSADKGPRKEPALTGHLQEQVTAGEWG
jgi:integrase